ncbi:cytochrome c family protein [Sphingobium aquiterrae]|uniref:c-type cytochrome n=1 Tax=Sphingobium aquiterrae TaxID=2038656 RepID=UPI003018D28C
MPVSRLALISVSAAMAVGAGAMPAAAQTGDAAKGKVVFARCAICHTVQPGPNKIGPSLAGLFGRKAGTAPGFAYSPAMKTSKIVWNAKTVDGYVTRPAATVPGTKMAFAGIANPADRANLIAYLATATKAR